jgi:glycosyltransferase involved in cell wall biosynthesis
MFELRPLVSIIVPARNEERYIVSCLESILQGDYPTDRLEVLVVEGGSVDRTRELVASFAARHPTVRLLDNPGHITPAALNIGVRAAIGEIIMRMDAHVIYPRSYVALLVTALDETVADSVGGVILTLPANDTPVARAIALALGHPFGVGNAYFRIGARRRRWVDAAAFGCYRRAVFDRIGLFDEELIRNQDDEFDLRLIKHGGRILLLPEAVAFYYARGSLRQVGRMYFQYGYFKPLVAKKLGRVMTVRQLVPATFLLSLASTALLGLWWAPAALLCAGILGSYVTACVGCAAGAVRQAGVRSALALLGVFPVLHVSYGLGFLKGIGHHLLGLRRRPADASAIALSR